MISIFIRYFLLTLLLILLDVTYFFGFTHSGLQLGAAILAEHIPGKLSIQKINGSLLSEFSLQDIKYQLPDKQIHIQSIAIDWDPKQLLNAQVDFKKIAIGTTEIKLLNSQSSSSGDFDIKQLQWLRLIKLEKLVINNIQINSKDADINVNGELTDQWNLNWKANIPNLKNISTEVRGSLKSSGKIYGSRLMPDINADININRMQYLENKINRLHANVKISLQPNTKSSFILDTQGLKFSDYTISKINLAAIGNLKWQKQSLKTDFDFALDQQKIAHIQLAFPDIKVHQLAEQTLEGVISLNTNRLSVLTDFISDLQKPSGNLQGEIKLKGLLLQPSITAKLILNDGRAFIPAFGTQLEKIHAEASMNQNQQVQLIGNLRAGDGLANLQGSINLASSDLATTLTLQGNNLTVINLEHYKIFASPNLKLIIANGELKLQGDITIPAADISPTDFSSTITMPTDVVFVGQKQKPTKNYISSFGLQISLVLGDKIKIHYNDLQTSLGGKLFITQNPGNPAVASGELYTVKGTYKAYGQTLSIMQGRLIYTGNTLDNPGLNIRAGREVQSLSFSNISSFSGSQSFQPIYTGRDTVSVGVQIAGTIHNPAVSLFSNPSMAQSDILSYLLLGRPQSQASGNQLGLLLSATSAMNLNGQTANIANVTQKLQNTLGLNELSVGSTEVFNPTKGAAVSTTSFIVGKQLAQNLYLHYSIGLFDPVSVLNLRYQLSKHFAVQSETSSIDSGADILYAIERE